MNPTSNFRVTLALIAVLHVAVIAAIILWMKSRTSAGSSAAAPSPNQEPAAADESPVPTEISPWMDPSDFVARADSPAPGRLPSATWTAPESDPESTIVLPLPPSASPAIALKPEPAPAPEPEPEPEPIPEPEPEPPLKQEKPVEAVPKVTRAAPVPAAKETPKKAPDPPEKEVPAKRPVPKVTRTAPVAARKAVPVPPTKKAEPAKPKEAPPKVSATKPADKPVVKTPPKSATAAPAKEAARKATPVSASGAAKPSPAAAKAAPTAVKSTSGQGAPAGEAAAGNGKSSSASPGGTGSSGDGRGNATEGDFSWYNGIIQSAFHNQWRQPKGLVGGEVLSTRATIRIGRDGSIQSAIISSPSGVREMDASVADALRTVRNITAPPPGIPDADLTVVVRFKLD